MGAMKTHHQLTVDLLSISTSESRARYNSLGIAEKLSVY